MRDVHLMSIDELRREVEQLRVRIYGSALDEARLRREALDEARREIAAENGLTGVYAGKSLGRW